MKESLVQKFCTAYTLTVLGDIYKIGAGHAERHLHALSTLCLQLADGDKASVGSIYADSVIACLSKLYNCGAINGINRSGGSGGRINAYGISHANDAECAAVGTEGIGQREGDAVVAFLAVAYLGTSGLGIAFGIGDDALAGLPCRCGYYGECRSADEGASRSIVGFKPAELALAFTAFGSIAGDRPARPSWNLRMRRCCRYLPCPQDSSRRARLKEGSRR